MADQTLRPADARLEEQHFAGGLELEDLAEIGAQGLLNLAYDVTHESVELGRFEGEKAEARDDSLLALALGESFGGAFELGDVDERHDDAVDAAGFSAVGQHVPHEPLAVRRS